MPLISITRLHLRSVRFFPSFGLYTVGSVRQVRRAPGFVGGWLASEGLRGFWTATAWRDIESMRAFRNGAPHLTAMRKLLHWCDEASYVHFEQASSALPEVAAAYQRLAESGTVSKVLHPSIRQRSGARVGAAVPRQAAPLTPR